MQEIRSFMAYEATYTGGLYVALADVDGDGVEDLITGTGDGGGPRVRVLNGTNLNVLADFFAYESSFRGGVNVAAADLNGDGRAEVLAGAGLGGGPRVRVFSIAGGNATETANFFAYDPSFRGGVFVAAGDVDGDGQADIITGAGVGGGPNVKVFHGNTLAETRNFMAGDANDRGGVRVVVADVMGTATAEIITASGTGTKPIIRTFGDAGLTTLDSFLAFNEAFTGGVFVDAVRKP
jgi:hypothetical protein